MSVDASGSEFDPSYIAGLLDATGRVRFDISEQPDETFTVRPMLRIKHHETEMREAVLGSFLEEMGYQYELVARERGDEFFCIQQRSDLENLCEYLTSHSAQLVRELEFVIGDFADEFDFEILGPEEIYRFLVTRDELRYGWRPRGRYHVPPSDIGERFGFDNDEIEPPTLPVGGVRSDYSIEWMAGVFDGICRFRPSIHKSPEHTVGYGMYPIGRLSRAGVYDSFVEHVQRFCADYNLRLGDSSERNNLSIVFTGASAIRRVLDILFPRLLVLAQHAAVLVEEILPRFDDEEHHTKRGFYRLLSDFDPIARASGGPFRHREYDPKYFAGIWHQEFDIEGAVTEPAPMEQTEDWPRDEPDDMETLTVSPELFQGDLGRYRTLVDRLRRDEEQAETLTALYGDRCQLCGNRLARGDGTGFSEVHHLQPLGELHDGPDAPENMLVLCPDHHADFDNGVIVIEANTMTINHPYDSAIDGGKIATRGDHKVAGKYLRYHNEVLAQLGTAELQ